LTTQVLSLETCGDGPGLDRVVEVIDRGGILAYPAETMYGLGGDGLSSAVADRLSRIKKSDSDRAFLLLIDEIDSWRNVAARFPEPARLLAARYWPGPVTLLLPARDDCVAAQGGKVAVRVPDLPEIRRWITFSGRPLFSTSANRSGEEPVRTAVELERHFADAVDLLVVGPSFTAGEPPSTIIDATVDPPRLVRAGAVPFPE